MQLIAPTNIITRLFSNMLAQRLNICVDSKIAGSADKENIIRRKIADKSFYI